MNEYDSDVVAQMLTGAGLVRVYDPKTADIILVNTCVSGQNRNIRHAAAWGECLSSRENGLM